jgi:hypothetical protein
MVSEELDRVNNKSVDDNKSVDYYAVIESVDITKQHANTILPLLP